MYNLDNYKNSFDSIHAPEDLEREIFEMTFNKQSRNRNYGKTLVCSVTAAALFAALGIVAYAAGWFNMKDALIDEDREIILTHPNDMVNEDGTTETVVTTVTSQVDTLNLWAIPDSPEFKATSEWYDYYWHQKDASSGEEEISNESYNYYGAFTQTDFDKLDEICEKYSLKLLSGWEFDDKGIIWSLYDAVGIDPILKPSAGHSYYGSYWYDNGAFKIEGAVSISGNESELIDYQLMRYMKGYIAVGAYLNIGNAENYDYWEYTTSDGTTVVLLSSPEKSIVIADYENSLLAVNILGSYGGNDFSNRTDLEAFAETFDFSVID